MRFLRFEEACGGVCGSWSETKAPGRIRVLVLLVVAVRRRFEVT